MSPGSPHGLVVGKFYPPHVGHLHLITLAAEKCARLSVVVMAARAETISLDDRIGWLRAACANLSMVAVIGVPCDVPVDFGDPLIWAAQVAVIRAALEVNDRPPVQVVFSSEPYGDELGAWFDATPVCVDPGRSTVPVAASAIRADLAGHWDDLIEPARAGLAVRVVLVGAESTGTTTIAGQLAEHYRQRGGAYAHTECVTEAGRDYTIIKWRRAKAAAAGAGWPEPPLDALVWTTADFDAVAAEQTAMENRAAAGRSPLVVCDTDAFATSVWERRYLGPLARPPQPWATGRLPRPDVYLLTSHADVPWQDDGLREGDLEIREAMTGWFASALTAAGHSWVLLTGSLDQRLALAVRVTDAALEHRARFGPAITDGVASIGPVAG